MNTAHSAYEYRPTIIETKPLIIRLLIQISCVRDELKRSWPDFKENPVACTKAIGYELLQRLHSSPNAIPATLAAVVAITCGIVMLLMVAKSTRARDYALVEVEPEIVLMDLRTPLDPRSDAVGRDGTGRF